MFHPRRQLSGLITRRESLLVGAAAFGLSLTKLAPGGSVTPARARSVVILYLSGGPSQLDMWDLKPKASEEIRGTFRPISTSVPGTQISEHLPRMARIADKYTIVRSMTHNESDHLRAGYWVMTGGRLTRPIDAYSGMERTDRPHLGGILAKARPARGLPGYVVVPEYVSPREVARPGQHAGFLGAASDPYVVHSDPSHLDFDPGPLGQAGRLSTGRIATRRELLHLLETRSRMPSPSVAVRDLEAAQANAFELVTSEKARKAFNLNEETTATRQRYGDHAFGQSALIARRLVEAGVRVVQVNFPRHDHSPAGQGYDSHSSPPNPPHLSYAKDYLLPQTDAAFTSLVEDLDDRGLLDETLVVMMGEFGRTPSFNTYGGRDHWPGCYSLVMAGGGTPAGAVYGESDKTASTPVSDPVSPDDLLATLYHLMGIDAQGLMRDLDNRPVRISEGTPIAGLIRT